MSKQRLLEIAAWCHENGAVRGEINDVLMQQNLIDARPKYAALGCSWANFRKMLKYYRELKQHEEIVEEIEVKKARYTPPNTGDGFYDSVDMTKVKL